MTGSQFLQIMKCFTGESLRQAVASYLFPLLLFYSAMIISLAATVRFSNIPEASSYEIAQRAPVEEAARVGKDELEKSGIPLIQGEIRLLFGAVKIPWVKFRENAVRYFESMLVFFTSDAVGLIFALIWTAGFIPEFLQGFWWNMLRLRPLSTGFMLLGKTFSIVIVLSLHGIILIGGSWIALGIATNVWNGLFLWSFAILIIQFICFYPASVFLGTWSRSSMVAIIGSIAFWAICWMVNHARISNLSATTAESSSGVAIWLIEIAYWALPKPIDFSIILSDLMGTIKEFPPPTAWMNAFETGNIIPFASIGTSLISSVVVLWFSCMELKDPIKE